MINNRTKLAGSRSRIAAVVFLTTTFCSLLILIERAAYVHANLTINNATLNLNNYVECTFSSITISLNGAINCTNAKIFISSGGWANYGTFSPGVSTVAFITANSTATLQGNTTFYNFLCEAPNKWLYFAYGSTQTVLNKFTLSGSTPNSYIYLRSSLNGSKWYIAFPNGPQEVYFVDVKDSDALYNNVICWNSVNSGNNNNNWIFNYDNTPPAGISNLTALKGSTQNTIVLQWTSPGDDGTSGNLTGEFIIKYSTVGVITSNIFDNPPPYYAATTVIIATSSLQPLTACTTTLYIPNLLLGVTYYFAIKTKDDVENLSVWNSYVDSPGVNTKAQVRISPVAYTQGSGNWYGEPAVWEEGAPPWPPQQVTILSGHTVVYNKNDTDVVTCSTITIYGTLQFDGAISSRAMTVAGDIMIMSGGAFLMPPNTGYVSILRIKCDFDGQYGVIVNNGGKFDVQGTTMPYWRTKLSQFANAGDTSITTVDATGWKAGDVITIGTTADYNQTEERTITSINGNSITLSSALSYAHNTGAEIVNITRNCVITSTGTAKAYIRNLSQVEDNFNMYYVEVSSMGANAPGKYGITFEAARGKINYSSIHHSSCGIYLYNSSSNTITNNSCYSNSYGIGLNGGATNNTLTNNSCYSNFKDDIYPHSYGIYLYGATNNTLTNNSCYSNGDDGISLFNSSNNTLTNNSCYSNVSGISIYNSSNDNTLTDNSCYSNNHGIHVETSFTNTIINNRCYLNDMGIALYDATNNTLTNNSCYSNSYGISLLGSSNNTLANNSCYLNSYYGILSYYSTDNMLINCELGKEGYNVSDISFYPFGYSSIQLKDCRLYSSTKVDSGGISVPGSYIISYNQDGMKGVVKIWGDYTVSSGQLLKCNYSSLLYTSTATQPTYTLRGTGSISYPTTDDGKTQTEFWVVKCTGTIGTTSYFEVKRSSAVGAGAAFVLDGTATEGTPYTSLERGVSFTVNPGDYQLGDAFYFVTISSSADSNVQKRIEFYDTPVGTKLTVSPGGEIQMIGSPLAPTISTAAAANNYYSFTVSGTINASNYVFSNLNSSGVVILPGAYVVDLSSGTFDNIQDSAGDSSYIRVSGITSNTTFYGCAFNDTAGTADYNIKADGSGINWTFRNWSGIRGGPMYTYATNGAVVNWEDLLPPAAVTTLSATAGSNPGEILLTWISPGDDGFTGDIYNGKYRLRYATYTEVDFSEPQGWNDYQNKYELLWTTNTSPLTTQYKLLTGLRENVSYYIRLWTADEVPNWSLISNGATSYAQETILSVSVDIETYSFGILEVGITTISVTSATVKNNGNVAATWQLRATTATINTPWQLSNSAGVDKFVLWGVFNDTQPSDATFSNEDKLSYNYQQCTTTVFAGNQSGYSVPPNAERIFWWKLQMPLVSNTTEQQEIRIEIISSQPP